MVFRTRIERKTTMKNPTQTTRRATTPMIVMYIIILLSCIAVFIVAGVSSCEKQRLKEECEETAVVLEIVTEDEDDLVSLGQFRLTAYCSCEQCCGIWAQTRPVDSNGDPIVYTASTKLAKSNWTIAADTDVLPFGTRVWIYGHEYAVQDRGGAIDGNSIDIYFDDHQDALEFGLRYADVFVNKKTAQVIRH